jgi:Fe-Mn family superoxide dismutase
MNTDDRRLMTNEGDVFFPRREAMATLGLGALAGAAALVASSLAGAQGTSSPIKPTVPAVSPEALGWNPKSGQYVLPPLPYGYEALEPSIDAETMHLHHDKHHKAYVDGLNKALTMLADIRAGKRPPDELKRWSRELAFNGSGHMLHVLFWNVMGPASAGAGGQPRGTIAKHIDQDFGSFKAFSDQFQGAATSVEGGGWAIVVFEPVSGQLMIMQAERHQDLTMWGVVPVLPIDVWEHAYYLKYKNARKDYVAAFMNVINWDAVDRHFGAIVSSMSHGA